MRFQGKTYHACVLTSVSAIGLGAALAGGLSAPAFAQESASDDRVVVTGSRIQRQDFTANSPIVTVDSSTFENTSTIGLESILNQLPQFVPALTQFTAGDIQPTATNTVGSSTVSLRGLGSNRSLVLVDGRRAMPVNASLVVDTNSIPSAAVQRVEIISGGASAVYGADAVGGVVNFILKDNYEGLSLDARYGLTEVGDSPEFQASALFGANIANGRGNVMFGMEHASRGWADQNERQWRVDELADPNVLPTDFWFDGTFFTNRTSSNTPSLAAIATLFPELTFNFAPGVPAANQPVARNTNFYINSTPDGTGSVFTGVRTFGAGTVAGAAGSYRYTGSFENPDYPGLTWRKIHPDGSIGQNGMMNYLSRPMERYSTFGRGRYELTDSIDVVAMGNFAQTKGRTVSQPTAALGSNGVIIPVGNTVYTPSVGANNVTLAAYRPGGAYGLNCPATGGCTESQAFPLPPEVQFLLNSRANPNDDIVLNTTTHFLPNRQTISSSTTYQLLLGMEGSLANDWVWDAHISHGETFVETNLIGDLSRDRFRAIAGAPNFGQGFQRLGNADFGGARSGVANCTTGLPLIRSFTPSQDCIDAITAGLHTKQNIVQNAAEANLAGDLFALPAGELGFAVGGAYREYDFAYYVDNLNRFESFIEQTMGARPGNDSFGQYNVGELYGELLVPILADLPLIEHFNLELGGRYSDYSTVGSVFTYKVLADWAITDWARLRGGLNKATRAPNLAELYMSRTQTFSGTAAVMGDQCSERNASGQYGAGLTGEIVNGQFVWDGGYANVDGAAGAAHAKAVCAAIMGATAAEQYYGRSIAEQPNPGGIGDPNTVGNPNLGPEDAETWTLGTVLNSPFDSPVLTGLSLSVDYFRIDLTNMIASKNGDATYMECLSIQHNPTADPETAACQSIVRDTINGNAISIDTTYTNEGRSITEGIDVQLDWRSQFEDLGLDFVPGGISLNVLATFNLTNSTQATPASNVIDWTGTRGCALGLSCMGYDYRVFTTFNWFNGPFSASLRWQHYPSILHAAYATNPATVQIGVPTSYNIFALSGSYRVAENMGLRVGVENLFNKKPPLGGGNPAAAAFPQMQTRQGGGTYDPLGRRFFAGFDVEF